MTHPFHPLHGRSLDIVDRRRCQDGEYVYLEVDAQRVERLPAAWTSLGSVDPIVLVATGRSLFRSDDLARLADIVAQITSAEHAPADRGEPGDT